MIRQPCLLRLHGWTWQIWRWIPFQNPLSFSRPLHLSTWTSSPRQCWSLWGLYAGSSISQSCVHQNSISSATTESRLHGPVLITFPFLLLPSNSCGRTVPCLLNLGSVCGRNADYKMSSLCCLHTFHELIKARSYVQGKVWVLWPGKPQAKRLWSTKGYLLVGWVFRRETSSLNLAR